MLTVSTAPRVLRTVKGYALDQWGYRYIDGTYGPYGSDHSRQFSLAPGAFDDSLARGDEVILTADLSGGPAFARRSDGTLRLTSDDVGLLVEADLLDTPRNRALIQQIDAGKVRGWSHRFDVSFLDYDRRMVDGVELTEIYRATLTEVCVVISKGPRQVHRTTPIFLKGGPRPALTKHCCCQTSETVGLSVCEEMTPNECAQLGGLFLGVNTRCHLEGCGGCTYPGPCSAFCDQYRFQLRLFSAACWTAWWTNVVGDFPLDVVLERVQASAGACEWVWGDAVWNITLTLNTGTTPRTWTIQVNQTDGDSGFSLTAVATAFCNAPNIGGFAVTAFSSTLACEDAPPTGYYIQLFQWSGCPPFNG